MRIGITGAEGFIGSHLRRRLVVEGDEVSGCPRTAWGRAAELAEWVRELDAVVHLAGLSRHVDGEYLYHTNVELTERLIAALERAHSGAHIYLGSTTHEAKTLPYHASKRESRRLLEEWAVRSGNKATTLLMANTFGPGSRPFFNSVVATFCCLAARGETPERIDAEAELNLIYVDDLVREIADAVHRAPGMTGARTIDAPYRLKLGELWTLLQKFRAVPPDALPELPDCFAVDLWSTFRSYRP